MQPPVTQCIPGPTPSSTTTTRLDANIRVCLRTSFADEYLGHFPTSIQSHWTASHRGATHGARLPLYRRSDRSSWTRGGLEAQESVQVSLKIVLRPLLGRIIGRCDG